MRMYGRFVSTLAFLAVTALWPMAAFADVAPPPDAAPAEPAEESGCGCAVSPAEPAGAIASLALGAGLFFYLRRR